MLKISQFSDVIGWFDQKRVVWPTGQTSKIGSDYSGIEVGFNKLQTQMDQTRRNMCRLNKYLLLLDVQNKTPDCFQVCPNRKNWLLRVLRDHS